MSWDERYPPQEALRAEASAMADAVVEAVLGTVGRERIRDIYLKGSAFKRWESPLDYVPELSDVDVHLWLEDEDDARFTRGMRAAAELSRGIESRFHERVPEPLHFPRPQLVIVNDLLNDPDLVASPPATMHSLYGKPYPTPRQLSPAEIRATDRARLLGHAPFLGSLPGRVMDRPGRHLTPLLREMSWRVSPVASRCLSVLGRDYEEAWGQNRTRLIAALSEAGQGAIAAALTRYYLRSWDFFLSGHEDGTAATDALVAGAEALQAGAALAARE